MSRKLTAFIFLFVLSFVLTACSIQDIPVLGGIFGSIASRFSKTEPVTLEMWGLWEPDTVINAVILPYQEQHPNITINYLDKTKNDPRDNLIAYKESVYTQLADPINTPDIVLVHNSWVPGMVGNGLLSSMPSMLMSTEEYRSAFYPVASESAVFGGDIYAIPLHYDGLALIYNKDHFIEAGQSAPPTDWEELRALAFRSTMWGDNNKILRSGIAMGGADNIDHFSDILGLMFAQSSIDVTSTQLYGEAAIGTMEYYTDLVRADHLWHDSFSESIAAFSSGQVSMIFAPSWRILEIKRAAPDLNFGVAPVPQITPDSPVAWGTFWMEAVSVNSPNTEEAWQFVKYLSEEQQQKTLYSEALKQDGRDIGPISSRVSLAGELSNNEYLYPIVQTAPIAKSSVLAGRSGNRKQVTALKDAVNAVLSGRSIEEALTAAQPQITK